MEARVKEETRGKGGNDFHYISAAAAAARAKFPAIPSKSYFSLISDNLGIFCFTTPPPRVISKQQTSYQAEGLPGSSGNHLLFSPGLVRGP